MSETATLTAAKPYLRRKPIGWTMCWEIVPVPGTPPCSSISQATVDVIAAVVEPKLVNTIIRRLSQVSPLENLRHVKRVRRRIVEEQNVLSLILYTAVQNDNHLEGIPDDVLEVVNDYQLSPFTARVAKYASSSKEEWEEQCKLWPTSYHPPTRSEDDLPSFTEEVSQKICNFMKIAIELTNCGQLGCQGRNAAVIVDPSSDQIIASAVDQTCSRTGMMGVSMNAEVLSMPDSNGKELEINEDFCPVCAFSLCSCTAVSCLVPWKWTENKSVSENNHVKCGSDILWHPLRHAVMVAIENAAARDKNLFPNSASMKQCDLMDDSDSNHSPLKRQKTEYSENEGKLTEEATDGLYYEATRPYLCTGYDIFLVWEPCTMCAMALVHQRIHRIFYAFPNPNAGALGSVCRLQGEKSLNHHYSVFRILLPEDASDE